MVFFNKSFCMVLKIRISSRVQGSKVQRMKKAFSKALQPMLQVKECSNIF